MTTRPYPPPRMRHVEHITEPRRAWHEDADLYLQFRVQRMQALQTIEHNGFTITKSWTSSEGNRWHVYRDGSKPLMVRTAAEALEAVSETETVKQEAS